MLVSKTSECSLCVAVRAAARGARQPVCQPAEDSGTLVFPAQEDLPLALTELHPPLEPDTRPPLQLVIVHRFAVVT
jgi:hypothetical protein